jgi:hypothetical protein
MRVKHELVGSAICPVDLLPDSYNITVESKSIIPVEKLLQIVSNLKGQVIYQEEYTMFLSRTLGCKIKTVCYHSGVKTEVVCE